MAYPYSRRRTAARRAPFEFPVTLDIQFRVSAGPCPVEQGVGRTIFISSREIVFETDQRLPRGSELEARIAWPIPLDQETGLQLVATLLVTDVTGRQITAAIRSYQFRTRGHSGAPRPIAVSAAASSCDELLKTR